MAIDLDSVPTKNSMDLVVSLYLGNKHLVELAYGDAKVLSLRFDRLEIGRANPARYRQDQPIGITISPGNIAYFEQVSLHGQHVALRFGTYGHPEQSVMFVRL